MGNWIIKNKMLFYEDDVIEYIDSSILYNFCFLSQIDYKGKKIYKPENIRFSKIGLNSILTFNYINENIVIKLFALKNNEKFEISIIDNDFSNYIIIDNVWYFLNINQKNISEILRKYDLNLNESINFNIYMNLIKELKKSNIEFEDNVLNDLKNSDFDANIDLKNIGLLATLFPYQSVGCKWLDFMVNNNVGCILGDEMGLGKTLQVIATIGLNKGKDKHFLVICPVSLLENWNREIKKFFPSLTVLIHHGSRRTGAYYELLKYDVIIMSYSNVQTDLSMLNMITWDIIILDEAQNIKNPYANRTKMVKSLNKNSAIAVTGTPFENHMTDIWSIVDFVMPNYLGSISEYSEDTVETAYKIEKLVSPIMIRRRVKDVAQDLPDRIDIPQPIIMTDKEAIYYDNERKNCIEEAMKELSINKIQSLRMFCTHPMVYNTEIVNVDPRTISNKYDRLCEILEEIFENKEKVIIFTSFNKMIEIICEDIRKRYNKNTYFINGSIDPKIRQEIVDNFSNENDSAILVLNPRAAGTGLNITAANHVIHYNLEWNPALEDQASARVYRRGQNKKVFIHRLYYANTIEEVINERIQTKRDISDVAIVGNAGTQQDKKDLLKALNLSPLGGKNG